MKDEDDYENTLAHLRTRALRRSMFGSFVVASAVASAVDKEPDKAYDKAYDKVAGDRPLGPSVGGVVGCRSLRRWPGRSAGGQVL